MQVNRQIRRRFRRSGKSAGVVADVNVAVAGSIGEPGRTARTSVRSRQTVVHGPPSATADDHYTKEATK
jgi:hypothetical protein